MITLLPLQKIFIAIAVIYAVGIALLAVMLQLSGMGSISAAFKGAFILEMGLLFFCMFGWKRLWSKFPVLNSWVYPDLNGQWKISIHWNSGNKKGTKLALAYIKQDLFRLSMVLVSDESESETLMVKPMKDPESARPMLYYIYQNEPAQGVEVQQPSHKGAAILKLGLTDHNSLKGNYFTDRATSGHFELRRVDSV